MLIEIPYWILQAETESNGSEDPTAILAVGLAVLVGLFVFVIIASGGGSSKQQESQSDTTEKRLCPNCENTISADASVCPHCRYGHEDGGDKIVCGECGTINDKNYQWCQDCGEKLNV